MKRILKYDWDAIAGIIAAVVAIIMHMLHVIDAEVLLVIAVVLLAILFCRELRQEKQFEHIDESLRQTELAIKGILAQLTPPDVVLVGPLSIRQTMEDFSRRARNDMLWFHVCPVMFKRQELFNALLRTAIDNPTVKSIQFVLDSSDRDLWESEVKPKIMRCEGQSKVKETIWTTISGGVSAIISDVDKDGKAECLLSFWGEPFMARTSSHNVPRYVFHAQSHSELVSRMVEVVRTACMHKC